jgi:hypothetical protein
MKITYLIKPLTGIGCIVFLICCWYKKPVSWEDYSSYISYAASIATVGYFVYERWFWRIIPWKRPPVLKKHYDGVISYTDKGTARTKQIDVFVKQSLFSVKVETRTDINSSHSITASIVLEYDSFFLYYTYITNPDANVQKGNPIQHGTCRMALQKDTSTIKGKYWTTSRTIGDIQWREHIN